jgi:ribosomal protein S12 methylthiotransferase accessory factor
VAALHEFIERDAVTEWQAGGLLAAMAAVLDLDSVRLAWLALWRERIAAAGAWLQVYRVPTLTGTPLFACELNDSGKDNMVYRAVQGRGCHPIPEVALFKALAEALQARVTLIAGSRDDQLPAAYRRSPHGARRAFAPPLPAEARSIGWDDVATGPADPEAVATALARAGYPDIAWLELAAPPGLSVVRAFVCGLGSMRRRRREP